MCFKLNKKAKIRRNDYFDELVGKHGNIQTCRDYKACQIYCAKDGDYITHNVDIQAVVESTKTKKGVKHETVVNFIKKQIKEKIIETNRRASKSNSSTNRTRMERTGYSKRRPNTAKNDSRMDKRKRAYLS